MTIFHATREGSVGLYILAAEPCNAFTSMVILITVTSF